jgi:hypothetical protein
VLGEFRKGLSVLFDPDSLDAVVESGVAERAPETRFVYTAFCDVASGSGSDSFALAIAHRESDVAVLDAVRRWAPPFNPEDITREAAALLQQYRLQTVTGDKYASGYQAAAWRKAGINKKDSKRDTSGNYLEMLLAVNSGAVRLLDHDRALRELRTLERKTGTGGRDRVDHRRGAHDDLAAAIAGAIAEARTTATLKLKWKHDGMVIWPEPIEGIDNRGCEWRDGQPWNGDFRRSAKLIERYRNGRQVGSDGRTLWVLARRPGANPAMAPTQIHRTQYEREGDWILAEGEE